MKELVQLRVNGEDYEVAIEPHEVLVDVLREKLGLTGTKKGCDGRGECGACIVIIDGKAVNSCLTLAIDARDRSVLTIEGVAESGKLHPIQQAFVHHWAMQCGFCTPAKVLSAKALFDENSHPTEEEIKTALASSLCRCTNYAKYKEALLDLAQGPVREEKEEQTDG